MTKDLYFLRLIAEALKKPDSKTAIEVALKKIKAMGQLPEYKLGFKQFNRFMAEVNDSFKRDFEEPVDMMDMVLKDFPLKIIIERNGENIISIPLKGGSFSEKIKNIKPGKYDVRLSTGRMLWHGELTEQDLVWTAAFPETDMALAADTGDHAEHMTREIRLLEGELVIRVMPELESGCIEIEKRGLNFG
jgi:hypothetical protein